MGLVGNKSIEKLLKENGIYFIQEYYVEKACHLND